MGVSGCGKSTLGLAIARALGWRFVEGDTLHPPANIAKMAAGLPLDDGDRWPFLKAVADTISGAQPSGIVVSCSALKRSYRDFIRDRAGAVHFVLPMVDREQLSQRLRQRANHFMPATLLESQLAALELPQADERVIVVDGTASTEAQVMQALAALQHQDRDTVGSSGG